MASRNYKHPSIVRCEVYFDILNHLGVAHKCDGQRDRRTDIMVANMHFTTLRSQNIDTAVVTFMVTCNSSTHYCNIKMMPRKQSAIFKEIQAFAIVLEEMESISRTQWVPTRH